ncbi:hypothetical protein [Paraliomyxa miuraensis]|uniref:hypothetical protein n=1 Tax=Paraliomyxa miuraensis TaxID=376150 RepID=UPI0022577CD1|nr:hypothetical protein [Paraliomyxa miuraensis]MCX4240432.1 hypothetical protein [Paraliomyxa miuraensis]
MRGFVSPLCLAGLGLVLGCADDAPPSGESGSTAATDSSVGGAGIVGMLIDANEQPIADEDVLGCLATTCYFGKTAADGSFAFTIDPPAEVALKTHPDPTRTPRWAAALEPIRLVDDDVVIDAGTVYVPELPAGAVIDTNTDQAQVLAVGDGLELTVLAADLSAAPGVFLYDLAAARIPDAHVPPYPELGDREVVAVFGLHPFETTCGSPIAVRLPTSLPDGTTVELSTIDHLDGTLDAPVPGHVEAGFIVTDPGQGITRLTHLVISRYP